MPRSYNISTVSDFKGVNRSVEKHAIAPNEFASLSNFFPPRKGYLRKRKGFYREPASNAHPQPGGGFFRLLSVVWANSPTLLDKIWATDGINLYWKRADTPTSSWNSTTGTPMPATGVEWGFVRAAGPANPYHHYFVRSTGASIGVVNSGVVFNGFGPVGTFTCHYKGRQWIINSDGQDGEESKVHFSAVEDFITWAPNVNAGTISISPGDGQRNISMQVYNDDLYIFKDQSIWKLNASSVDQTTYSPQLVHASVGCIGRGSIQVIDGFMYFVSQDGVYRTDGTTFERISDKLNANLASQIPTNTSVKGYYSAHFEGMYIFTSPGSPTINCFDTTTEEWVTWAVNLTTGGNAIPMGFVQYGRGVEKLYMGSDGGSGYMYVFDPVNTWYKDDTIGLSGGADINNFVGFMEFGFLDDGAPTEVKRNFWVGIDCEGAATTSVEVRYVRKDTLGAAVTKSLTHPSRTLLRFPGAGRFREIGLRVIFGTNAGQGGAEINVYGVNWANSGPKQVVSNAG